MVTLGNALGLVRDRLETFQQHLRHSISTEGAIATTVGSVKLLTFERYRVCELWAEMLHCSNMAIMNRGAEFKNPYDADGRLQGGLQGLEQLAKVIAIASGEDQNRDEMGEDNDKIEPAMEPPVSNASRNSPLLISSDEDTSLEMMRWKRSRCTMNPCLPQISHLLHPQPPTLGSRQQPVTTEFGFRRRSFSRTAHMASISTAESYRLFSCGILGGPGTHSQGAFARLASSRSVLGRKVKNADRPNCCPAQHLVFDALKAEVLDCWRVKFGVSDLDQRFKEHSANFENLLGDARALCQLHISGSLVENAVLPNPVSRPISWRQEVDINDSRISSSSRRRFIVEIPTLGDFSFKDIIASNIRAFFGAKDDAVKSVVRLAKIGGAHHRTFEAAMNRLAANTNEHQLHRYREGRKWGYEAPDDLEAGFTMLPGC
ncbi:hypothetical protein FIBSPDRAFT_1051069 [Athelia psychrophila]|uniref:DUF6589 domain-containing protein n=1 Tax=Athelia psychrophila TaxID=1759441 RepID=A0A165ZR11_9AGAM|nr:hypothetical protein FIBSPDRAFT_1051069 [Fibularhizoctonia sp. CBS 109695]